MRKTLPMALQEHWKGFERGEALSQVANKRENMGAKSAFASKGQLQLSLKLLAQVCTF
jgi:hypothetical protein